MSEEQVDIAIIGGGAAGLMAGIWAGRAARAGGEGGRRPRIVILDGAKHLGAKILVAGGGRCNVTHDVVSEIAFAGSSRHAIRKVLRRFDVPQTIEFFRKLGVELKREETGKLFPVTDKARTVLDALLRAVREVHVEIRHPFRVESITTSEGQAPSVAPGSDSRFTIRSPAGTIHARCVILATGGKSLPKTGSDGRGYELAQALGHTTTPRLFPALVPLTLLKNHFLCALSGVSAIATLEVHSGTGKRLHSFTDSTLCTHFGLSGPAVLDISRHYIDAKRDDPDVRLLINWLPGETLESVDAMLQSLGKISCGRWLREGGWRHDARWHDARWHDAPRRDGRRGASHHQDDTRRGASHHQDDARCGASLHQASSHEGGLPQRLAEALCHEAGVDPSAPGHQLTREKRRALAAVITQLPLPITGDRGFAYAEVTAGGVPLSELRLETMESRVRPALYICGEICDVDGRIGGYNFQWAWASGYVAGNAAGSAFSAHQPS